MAGQRISELPALTGTNLAAADLLPVVDTSAVASSSMTVTEFVRGFLGQWSHGGAVVSGSTYNPGQVVVYTGTPVLITKPVTATGGFISASNYIRLGPIGSFVFASDFGFSADGLQTSAGANVTALNLALLLCNPTGANGVGGKVVLPRGNPFTNAVIDIPNGVHLEGQGTVATYWKLADGANCTMVRTHVSTGSGNPNAEYGSISNMTLDCNALLQGVAVTDAIIAATSTMITSATRPWVDNELVVGTGILPTTKIVAGTQAGSGPFTATMTTAAQQTISGFTVLAGFTAPIYGIHLKTNPPNTLQTGDFGFDKTDLVFNVHIRNARAAGLYSEGRSDLRAMGVKVSNCYGNSFVTSFDCHYTDCISEGPAWDGFVVAGSSCQFTNCKAYLSGQAKTVGATQNNNGRGFYSAGTYNEIALSSCDAQQCTGDSFRWVGMQGVTMVGCTSAQPGFAGGNGVGLYLDNTKYSTFVGFINQGLVSTNALALVNGSDLNDIRMTHSPSGAVVVGSLLLAGSTLANNALVSNGLAINSPGITSATFAVGTNYGRVSATGAWYAPLGSTAGTAIAPTVTNTAHLYPVTLPRAGMVVQEVSMRVFTATASSVCRIGLYSSDLTGNDVFNLLAEPTTGGGSNVPIDCSTTGIKTVVLASPVTVTNNIVWVMVVTQTATVASVASYAGGLVGGSNNNPVPNTGFSVSGVSGAMPATVMAANSQPVGLGAVIAVGVRATG